MTYLAHTVNAQLGALGLSCVGWALSAIALGLIQWRVWFVSNSDVITSGRAWVGLWRTCFHSHVLVSPGFMIMHCKSISLTAGFTPPEIAAGQILMFLSLLLGLLGNAGAVYMLRNVYLEIEKNVPTRLFLIPGSLCVLAAAASLIPLLWNISSVVTNQTIEFPPDFKMPPAPDSQQVGGGIGVGIAGAVLMTISGIVFCTYRLPARPPSRLDVTLREELPLERYVPVIVVGESGADLRGKDNAAFQSHERW